MLTVKNCWDRPVEGHAMWKFHQKMKRLSNTLSVWSRDEFGDIFQKVRMYEEQVHNAEKTTSLTKGTQIDVSSMKLMQSTSSFSSWKTLF